MQNEINEQARAYQLLARLRIQLALMREWENMPPSLEGYEQYHYWRKAAAATVKKLNASLPPGLHVSTRIVK
jgi:hypothetical protein